jgi:3-dehydroquinate synthase
MRREYGAPVSVGGKAEKIKIGLRTESQNEPYYVMIKNRLLQDIPEHMKRMKLGRRYAIITDSEVSELYANNLSRMLNNSGLPTEVFVFEVGEKSKTLAVCEGLMEQMSSKGFGRDSAVIAVGGGVVGDIAGLVSVLFNRGVPYVQVPTTLVAQADSSIGGKVGVNSVHGKNLYGDFKQPKVVYIDPMTLRTLDKEEYAGGLAETVKHAVIKDPKFFDYLENHTEEILRRTDYSLLHLARTNCSIKGSVVEKDPNEKGMRRVLNLGHTVGHAVEKLANFEIIHGFCVAIGTVVALRIANMEIGFPDGDLERVERLLRTFGLPTIVPAGISEDDIIKTTSLDKKAAGGQARYALPTMIGKMAKFGGSYATYVDDGVVRMAIRASR